ncbi:MAG: hypothetical protein FWD57_05905, partial [Polyangiaceae bacterium]|nr:hypothetical protein [Polyangiaceae bacterium]
FRLQFTYIHSANGGNNVKSRAERNEIYYNWIEGAGFHGLDLIGPVDDRGKARNDSDIVGNVIITTSSWQAARIGSDGHERTRGRYRFVNNTMIMGPDSTVAIRMQEEVESIELHNNVFVKLGEKEVQLVRHSDPHGPDPVIRGSNNWIQHGFVDIPDSLSNTQEGKSPEFADLDSLDLIPTETSPLVDCGTTSTVAKDSHAMPNPLKYAEFIPPNKMRLMPNTQVARSTKEIDIGAFEYGLPHAPPPDWAACHTESSSEDDSGSCFCGMAGRSSNSSTGWWVLAGLGVAVGVRRKVSPNRSGCRSESR